MDREIKKSDSELDDNELNKCICFESAEKSLVGNTLTQAIDTLKEWDKACRYGCSKFEDCTVILDEIKKFEKILMQENEKENKGMRMISEYDRNRAKLHLVQEENFSMQKCKEKELQTDKKELS